MPEPAALRIPGEFPIAFNVASKGVLAILDLHQFKERLGNYTQGQSEKCIPPPVT